MKLRHTIIIRLVVISIIVLAIFWLSTSILIDKGIDMGRNIWQSDNAVGMIKAVRKIVHEGASVKEAGEILNSKKNKK